MLDLVVGSYRGRVAFEWRAALLVAVVAALVAVVARFPGIGDGLRLLLGLVGVVVLVGLGLAVNAWFHPVELPAATPRRWRDHDVTAAQKQVKAGQSVEPPELQTAVIAHLRRELRLVHLNLGWMPVLGCTWSLRIGAGGFTDGLGYFGIVMMLVGIAGLGWSGVVQTRLDRLESRAADGAAPTTDRHFLDGTGAEL